MSVPKEIIDEMNEGRHFDNIIETYEKDGMLFKKMACGCEFGNGIKKFSFSNSWCDKHAPSHPISGVEEPN